MLKTLVFTLFLALAGPALACDLTNVRDIPEATVQKLKVECENARLATKTAGPKTTDTEVFTPENVTTWGDAVASFGDGIGKAAAAAGMAVNEFIKTPAGAIVTFSIIWALFGGQVIAILVAGVVMSFCWYAAKAIRRDGRFHEYDSEFSLFGVVISKRKKLVQTYDSYSDMGEFQVFIVLLLYVVGIAVPSILVATAVA